jgi:hypothetical protein
LKVGFGLRKDAPIEEIEIDISSFDEEEEDVEFEEEDVEGEVEEEDIRKGDDHHGHSHDNDEL